ncbi:MAG: ribonuclease III [Nevskiaceae bacterium]|nr:MAG: ribonuclease III [Nevskiaceae bacterium]TBR74168.1 MAG: ribonuclease III [Nevskiaceae bacterium]
MRQVAAQLGHDFSDPRLLQRACTHRSFGADNNERLEFLGDALIGLVVAAALHEARPQTHEGGLSRLRASLVCEASLAKLAKKLALGDALRLGEGELKSGGFRRDSILSDALEAVFGAIYLDGGFDAARRACLGLFDTLLHELPDARSLKDPKTRLQELLQARGEPVPGYEVVGESGPPHARCFAVVCRLADGMQCEADGSSRRKAEQEAAAYMLTKLEGGNA